jgi:hypothetical protein
MAKVFDILLDTDFDLAISAGDLVIGESTEQHQHLLLIAGKGSFVANPLIGVELQSWLNDETGSTEARHAIQREFEFDGMTVETLEIQSLENIKITAGYE